MTLDEAKSILHCPDAYGGIYGEKYGEALSMAMEALKREPCEDAISRQAVLNKILKFSVTAGRNVSVKGLWTEVNDLPSVTPQPKAGHWILADEQNKEDVENDNYRFICSKCQYSDNHAKGTIVPYCWNCGAKMVEPKESEVEE